MSKFQIDFTKKYKKSREKLTQNDKDILDDIVLSLANDKILDKKYKDHKLQGELKAYRECHIKPDLLLIYKKQNDILILTCVDVGSHSKLF